MKLIKQTATPRTVIIYSRSERIDEMNTECKEVWIEATGNEWDCKEWYRNEVIHSCAFNSFTEGMKWGCNEFHEV